MVLSFQTFTREEQFTESGIFEECSSLENSLVSEHSPRDQKNILEHSLGQKNILEHSIGQQDILEHSMGQKNNLENAGTQTTETDNLTDRQQKTDSQGDRQSEIEELQKQIDKLTNKVSIIYIRYTKCLFVREHLKHLSNSPNENIR